MPSSAFWYIGWPTFITFKRRFLVDIHLKEEAYLYCKAFIKDRIVRIQKGITEIRHALGTETKSTAGDKHETGRAMLQLEREKLGRQLAEVENMEKVMQRVDISTKSTIASLGSLVKTTKANYFLAVSAGEYKSTSEDKNYCISLNTPIGIMLLGKTIGETVNFDGNEIKILDII